MNSAVSSEQRKRAWIRLPKDLVDKAKSLGGFRSRVVTIAGTACNSEAALTMTYIGNETNLPFVLRTAFVEHGVFKECSRCNIWRAASVAEEHAEDADISVIDLPWPWDLDFIDDHHIIEVPAWIRQEIALADTWQGVLASLGKNVREGQLRKIRKHGLTSAISNEPSDADSFYDTMYVPHTRRRFGPSAAIVSRRCIRACVANGALLKIQRNGQAIAACALNGIGDTLKLCYIGFSVADLRAADGASAALYFFTLKHAFDNGYRCVDYYGSRPLLNDGVFATKRRWGGTVYDDWSLESLLIQLNEFSDGVRAFLANRPMITLRDGKLSGRVLIDVQPLTAEVVTRILRRYVTPGVDELRVYAAQGIRSDARAVARDSLASIELFDLQDCDDPLAAYCN